MSNLIVVSNAGFDNDAWRKVNNCWKLIAAAGGGGGGIGTLGVVDTLQIMEKIENNNIMNRILNNKL